MTIDLTAGVALAWPERVPIRLAVGGLIEQSGLRPEAKL